VCVCVCVCVCTEAHTRVHPKTETAACAGGQETDKSAQTETLKYLLSLEADHTAQDIDDRQTVPLAGRGARAA
jgi:hypothetical protein